MSDPSPSLWYSGNPVGKDYLAKALSRVATRAGLGKEQDVVTSQSLRLTCAFRLNGQGYPENLIRNITGLSKEKVSKLKHTYVAKRKKGLFAISKCAVKAKRIEPNENSLVVSGKI